MLVFMEHKGPFWDVVEGRAQPSNAAMLLGWELRSLDPDEGTIEVGYQLDDRFTNPAGAIQGGFLAAMLDDTLGPALVATLPAELFAPTISLHVQFLAPAWPGIFVGKGSVLRKGATVAFVSGHLEDVNGRLVAVGNASASIKAIGSVRVGQRAE